MDWLKSLLVGSRQPGFVPKPVSQPARKVVPLIPSSHQNLCVGKQKIREGIQSSRIIQTVNFQLVGPQPQFARPFVSKIVRLPAFLGQFSSVECNQNVQNVLYTSLYCVGADSSFPDKSFCGFMVDTRQSANLPKELL